MNSYFYTNVLPLLIAAAIFTFFGLRLLLKKPAPVALVEGEERGVSIARARAAERTRADRRAGGIVLLLFAIGALLGAGYWAFLAQ